MHEEKKSDSETVKQKMERTKSEQKGATEWVLWRCAGSKQSHASEEQNRRNFSGRAQKGVNCLSYLRKPGEATGQGRAT